jgi:hypothetical protein
LRLDNDIHRSNTPRYRSPKDYNSGCDDFSIGSTHSINFGNKRLKTAFKQLNSDSTSERHVVPSGGAKARANNKNINPHPCRYDEFAHFLPSTTAIEVLISKSIGVINFKCQDKEHPTTNDNRNNTSTSTDIDKGCKTTAENHTQVILTAVKATAKNMTATPLQLNQTDSWDSSTSGSTISTDDETKHDNSNSVMTTKTYSRQQFELNGRRSGKPTGRACNKT